MKSALLTLMLLVTGSFAYAQSSNFSGSLDFRYDPYTTESFRETCDVIRENRDRIVADCLNTRGRMVYNDFNRRNCRGDIANINGRLTCIQNGGEHGGGHRLPQGSYQMTCQSCQADSQTLYCQCEDTRGYFRSTSIQYRRCRGDIANMNGRLSCNY